MLIGSLLNQIFKTVGNNKNNIGLPLNSALKSLRIFGRVVIGFDGCCFYTEM